MLATARVPNQQVFFGTNVLARLSAALDGSVRALQDAVQQSVLDAIAQLGVGSVEQVLADSDRIVLAANSVMAPLFCGLTPEGLARAPFTASDVTTCTSGPLVDAWRSARTDDTLSVEVLAPLAAFVGGDARAVLIATGLAQLPLPVPAAKKHAEADAEATASDAQPSPRDAGTHLLVDLGTNAEILLRVGDTLFVASVPAGPTFEGLLGAGGAGMRGSDVIVLLAERLRSGAIDASGLITDTERALPLTQTDVRDFQLAKAAVRVGIDLVLEAAEIDPSALDTFHLVGAFGAALDPAAARRLGLFNPALPDPTRWPPTEVAPVPETTDAPHPLVGVPGGGASVNNAALQGAVAFLLGATDRVEGTLTPLELATDPAFEGAFIEALSFPSR